MECLFCKAEFTPVMKSQKFCSRRCSNRNRSWPSDKQRDWVSGNWYRYFNRLAVASKERELLTTTMLLEILAEQGGRCALTGVKLTNILVKGRKIWTNASVDRIVSGGPYIRSNVQLVCAAVNGFRSQMSIEEFQQWCRLVAKFRGLPDGKKLQARVSSVSRKVGAEEEPRPAKRRSPGAHAGGESAEGRREGRRPQAPNSGGGKQRPVKPSRNLAK